MSTTQNNEQTSPTGQTSPPSVPDGKSELPTTLPDYPNPGDSDSGGSPGTTGK